MAPALAAIRSIDHAASQNSAIRLQALTHDLESEVIESAELRQVRARKGTVRQVDVICMDGIGTPSVGDFDLSHGSTPPMPSHPQLRV
ncbi:hypothetical protein GCM10022202_31480 [Microbacterium marinilacus]|uniref:Uncharacterized protein n=1 Tax=Microbacterium marinilacus TaxID=415209 RepID=A0ABP7BSE5_9MICO